MKKTFDEALLKAGIKNPQLIAIKGAIKHALDTEFNEQMRDAVFYDELGEEELIDRLEQLLNVVFSLGEAHTANEWDDYADKNK